MTSRQINCPAPLPEGPADARLAKLLVPTPYVVPEKKAAKRATGTRKSARRQEVSYPSSDGSEAHSSREDEEEEEETSPPPAGGEKKRKADLSGRPEGPRRGKPFLRTTPPTPTTAKRSGRTGPSPWRNRKYPDTRVIHSIRLLHSFPSCRIIYAAHPKTGSTRRRAAHWTRRT